jgi:hypothetical protein
MQQEVIQKLFKKLKKCKYSTGRMRKFKNLVHRLELKLRGKKITTGNITKYNITPTEFFIRNKKLSKKYIIANNTLKKFIITHSIKVLPNSIIPVHINNLVHHKSHLNLLVILDKQIFRIDPNDPKITKIKTKNVDSALTKYFKKRGMKYSGMYRKNKIIKHGGLCRYATPLVYVYGKSLNHRIIKREIIRYFRYLIISRTIP